MAKFDIATALQKFTGETERNKALTTINSAMLAALGLEATVLDGKTAEEITAAVKAKVAPAAPAASGPDLAALLASAHISIGAGQTAEQALTAHATSHAALIQLNTNVLRAVGLKDADLTGKNAKEVGEAVAGRVAARSAEQLAQAGFSAPVADNVTDDNPTGPSLKEPKKAELTGADRIKASVIAQLKAEPELLSGQGRRRHQNVAGQPNMNN